MQLDKIIILIGMPGSGKGTLARMCVDQLGWVQLSTGDLCRRHISDRTEIGERIDFAIKSGKLVSDTVISEMVFDWLLNGSRSSGVVIFDGFPRTVEQSKVLHEFLIQHSPNFVDNQLVVVRVIASEEIVTARLGYRVICSNKNCQAGYSLQPESKFFPKFDTICDKCGAPLVRRQDDSVDSIKNRLHVYKLNESQLLDSFRDFGYRIIDLDGGLAADQVFADLKRVLLL